MSKPVKLNELIDEMELNFDEYTTFYHPKSGEFYSISDHAFAAAEGDESMIGLHDIEDEEIEIAGDIYENSSDYIELSDRFEIDEYAMLEEFSISVKDEKASRMLQIAIKGSGAFRRFKETVSELDLEQEWYSFRDEQYKKKAIEWCQINGLEYVE
ncbi:MAG: UPF0158 family protein [Bacillota bacterium]